MPLKGSRSLAPLNGRGVALGRSRPGYRNAVLPPNPLGKRGANAGPLDRWRRGDGTRGRYPTRCSVNECNCDLTTVGGWVHNSPLHENTFLALIGLGIIGTCALYGAPAESTLVEVWTGGDDGLTQQLRDAVERKFKSSSDFVPSGGKKPGTLIVTIPTHVAWTQHGTRTHVRYRVEFPSSDGVEFGKSSGSCWDDNFSVCAAQIYRGAKRRHTSCPSCWCNWDLRPTTVLLVSILRERRRKGFFLR